MNRQQTEAWWRVALRISKQFDASPKPHYQSNNSNRIRDSAAKLQTCLRKLDLALARNWMAAADVFAHDCQQAIVQAIGLLEETKRSVALAIVRHDVAINEVFRDLVAIDQEFDEFHFDAKEPKLSVVTPRISLEGLDLGRFRIELQCESLASTSTAYYEIIALDPNPAETNEGVIHPHVEANRLCEGEAQPTIRLALRQGRIFDFFQIVQQVLGTYNPSSAYTKIADWSGTVCSHCGYTPDSDDTRDCHRCQRQFVWNAFMPAVTVITAAVVIAMKPARTARTPCANLVESSVENASSPFALNALKTKGVKPVKKNQKKTPMPEQNKLKFSPTAWAKLLFLRDFGETEVGG